MNKEYDNPTHTHCTKCTIHTVQTTTHTQCELSDEVQSVGHSRLEIWIRNEIVVNPNLMRSRDRHVYPNNALYQTVSHAVRDKIWSLQDKVLRILTVALCNT